MSLTPSSSPHLPPFLPPSSSSPSPFKSPSCPSFLLSSPPPSLSSSCSAQRKAYHYHHKGKYTTRGEKIQPRHHNATPPPLPAPQNAPEPRHNTTTRCSTAIWGLRAKYPQRKGLSRALVILKRRKKVENELKRNATKLNKNTVIPPNKAIVCKRKENDKYEKW